jgi:hypothetical protein
LTVSKDLLDAKIAGMLATDSIPRVVARRLYLYDFATIFAANPERGFAIVSAISDKWQVPFTSVKFTGSAQTGYTYYKGRDFLVGDSDLDVAIIDPNLFRQWSEKVYWLTQAYTDLSNFPRIEGNSVAQDFRYQLSSGYFRPDFMPTSAAKSEWISFFNRLSNGYTDLFKNINAGVYMSEAFFEIKNSSVVKAYKNAPK